MPLKSLPLTPSHLRRLGASVAALALAATLSAAPGPLAPRASAQSLSLPSFVVIPTPIPGEPVDPAVIARTITEIHEQTNRERVAAGRAPVARSAAVSPPQRSGRPVLVPASPGPWPAAWLMRPGGQWCRAGRRRRAATRRNR